MPHYFTNDEQAQQSNPKRIAFRAHKTDVVCWTDHGVFARHGLDRGTKVLLDYLVVDDGVNTALDLGCGYGPIGITLAAAYDLDVDMVDVNKRALELTEENLKLNHQTATVKESDGFTNVDKSYDLIVSNPPIRIGKKQLYGLLQNAASHLNENGQFWFVINKKHGALSAITFVESIYTNVTVVGKSKGFFVIKCENELTI